MNFGDGRLRNEEMAKRIHFYGTDKKTSREKSERVNDRTQKQWTTKKFTFFHFHFLHRARAMRIVSIASRHKHTAIDLALVS